MFVFPHVLQVDFHKLRVILAYCQGDRRSDIQMARRAVLGHGFGIKTHFGDELIQHHHDGCGGRKSGFLKFPLALFVAASCRWEIQVAKSGTGQDSGSDARPSARMNKPKSVVQVRVLFPVLFITSKPSQKPMDYRDESIDLRRSLKWRLIARLPGQFREI